MKRLYVRPAFRGAGLGRVLSVTVIEEAKRIGYREMFLDTVPWMTVAITLYESLGFEETAPYRHNPIEGAKFMRLVL
jgi:GNAT superfamily N-acetyltransferase